jgi:glycosyltransferase involved in cell wall biosynthesis
MHIVFITHEYPNINASNGGVGTFVQTLARWLVNKGNIVSVVGINNKNTNEESNDFGVRIYRLPKISVKGFTWLLQAKSINQKLLELNEINPIQIIEGTELAFAFLFKIPKVKYLIRLNGGHHFFAESENRRVNWWKAFQEKRSFKKADSVVGVSQYVVEHTSKYINFENKKRGVVFNPANLKNFYPADSNKQVNKRIFFAGTVCEKKGVRQLIQAIPIVKESFPDAHLFIAGRDWFFPHNGKSYTEYVKQYIDPSVKDSIHFMGAISNTQIPKLIEEAEVCCYPSHMEAMPLAWIEVMAMGKAFVASKAGPGSEIIKNGVNGLLCDPLNPADIAKQIITLFKNQEMALNLGEHARKFALQEFDLNVIGPRNLNLYNTI